MTSQERVMAVHPRARHQRCRVNGAGGHGHYLIPSLGPHVAGSCRLGERKTVMAHA